ncbi:prophage PssSM-02 [Pseudomonas fluorescens NCIMB 11764]|uniref:Prophage PssSM-02 n=1 Tax=Pseudomonas fluorescens NCIMB 11764 TaxID=1221522 RepID=A0A0K1QK56_PSEFL|nr:hypothetical protein [Pseudomonas fluorescens]AKV06149.1 prophage PssSM-02 [Pseudomonas fluorescens NCIMB 11764]
MQRIIAAGLVALALSGCATSPMPVSEAKPVPSDEIYGFKSPALKDSGSLTVFRDDGFVGSGCDIILYIDGQRAAKIGPGQKVSFNLPAGDVNLGTGLAESGLCSGAAIKTVASNIKSGKEAIYRINGDMQGFYLGPYVDYSR